MLMGTYHADMPHLKKIIKNPRFLSRVYSSQEMKFLMSKNFSPYITAEMYCAKMAFKKVMGANFNGCTIRDISVLADYSGTYYVSLSGEIKRRFAAQKMKSLVSCSHSKNVVMATVIFYE